MSTSPWESAKQKVAERHGFKDWDFYKTHIYLTTGSYDVAYEEVFKAGCNECVKVDRAKVYKAFNPRFQGLQLDTAFVYMSQVKDVHKSLPLPFPENQ